MAVCSSVPHIGCFENWRNMEAISAERVVVMVTRSTTVWVYHLRCDGEGLETGQHPPFPAHLNINLNRYLNAKQAHGIEHMLKHSQARAMALGLSERGSLTSSRQGKVQEQHGCNKLIYSLHILFPLRNLSLSLSLSEHAILAPITLEFEVVLYRKQTVEFLSILRNHHARRPQHMYRPRSGIQKLRSPIFNHIRGNLGWHKHQTSSPYGPICICSPTLISNYNQ